MKQFTLVKRGYDTEEVDDYISTLEQVVKSYKDKDNAIKNAIISAQMAADNMIKNAKLQADEYKIQIVAELQKVRKEVETQRVRVQAFQDVYNGLVRKYLTELDGDDISQVFKQLDDVDNLISALMEADIVVMPDNTADNSPDNQMDQPDNTPAVEEAPNSIF